MKEITITEIIKIPTEEEIKEAGKEISPIVPETRTLITCFVSNYGISKATYECLAEAKRWLRYSIASDVAVAYCEENKIKWGSVEVIKVNEYSNHFVIKALIKE